MNRFTSGVFALMLTLLTGLTAASPVRAGEPRTHDGFFLRLSPGYGTGSAKIEEGGDGLELSGSLSDIDIAIGGRVGKNLMLHGTLFGWMMTDPKADYTISGFDTSTTDLSGDLMMSGFGGGLTYYMMPANVYFTGSVGMSSLTSELEDPFKGESDTGFAFTLGIGKEWWVGDSWGLGLAGGFDYFSAKDKNIVVSSQNWSGPSYSLRFSATFN